MRITSIQQTCSACPSQWEGKLADGRMFYIRYRWGYFSFRVSEFPTDDVYSAVSGEEVYGETIGDGLDGCMSNEQMEQLLFLQGINFAEDCERNQYD